MRSAIALLAVGLWGCSSLYREEPCGRQRLVEAEGPLAGPGAEPPAQSTASITVVDEEDRVDVISWHIQVSGTAGGVTAVHLHDRTPGHANRMIFDFPDLDGAPGFPLQGATDYSYSTSAGDLFELVRAGQVYLDIHTRSPAEEEARADLTVVQFEDWSGYYCS
jgi:hypothetical protein